MRGIKETCIIFAVKEKKNYIKKKNYVENNFVGIRTPRTLQTGIPGKKPDDYRIAG
jgi:hypothetical protein